MLRGMKTTGTGFEAAKAQIFHSMQYEFDKASEFMSAYISNRHAAAQHDYANRHGAYGRRRYVRATGSDGNRDGRGRAQGGRSGQRGGRGTGRGRSGRGRGNGRATRTYINNVDFTDPHRNFTSAEWEKLGTMRRIVIQMRDGNNSGRGGNDNRSTTTTSNTNQTTSGVSANASTNDENNTASNEAAVVSDMTEWGSQNGRSFGRGAYNNN